MKILLSILLLPSIFIGCGEKKLQDSQTASATMGINTLPSDDSDGDLIPNSEDTHPFIATLPKYEELVEIYDHERVHKQKEVFLKDNFKIDVKRSGIYTVLESENNYLGYLKPNGSSIKIKAIKNVSTFDLELSSKYENLAAYNDLDHFDIPDFSEIIMDNMPIYYKLSDYHFSYQGKDISKTELEKSILNKSYKITIIEDNIEHFYISSLLNLEDGLAKIDRRDLISKVKETRELLEKTHINLITNHKELYFVRNKELFNANEKIKAGSHITFIKTSKKDLGIEWSHEASYLLYQGNNAVSMSLDNLQDIKSFKMKAHIETYDVNLFETPAYVTHEPINLGSRSSGLSTQGGVIQERQVVTKKIEINETEFDEYFNFYLNDKQVNFSDVKHFSSNYSYKTDLRIENKYDLKDLYFTVGKCFFSYDRCITNIEETMFNGPFLQKDYNSPHKQAIELSERVETPQESIVLKVNLDTLTTLWKLQ